MSKANDETTDAAGDVFGRVFTLKPDLRQRDVALWNRAYIAYQPGRAALVDERQAALQAAIEAGWIESPPTRWEDVTDGATGKAARRHYFDGVIVDELTAAEVNYYGLLCSRHFDAALSVPKASPSR